MKDLLGKYKGCLLGGAAGDALGYPVEFLSIEDIYEEYGNQGITEHKLYQDLAMISDDTQLTMFTACGLLKGYTRFVLRGIMGDWASYVYQSYTDWWTTQFKTYSCPISTGTSWLLNIPQLYSCRAPGNTCLNALETHRMGRIYSPLNNSMGCGGVMRVAPVGLYLAKHCSDLKKVARVGAEIAAITHGNPLGYIPAAAMAYIVAGCVLENTELEEIVKSSVAVVSELFEDKPELELFVERMNMAVELSHSDLSDLDAIGKLGQGFVADEALAIAVYSCLRHIDDFGMAICAAVNHDGDSDSTGAIAGNILGAYLGVEQIPEKYLQHLELKSEIEELATDLHEDCQLTDDGNYRDQEWVDKYIYGTYRRIEE